MAIEVALHLFFGIGATSQTKSSIVLKIGTRHRPVIIIATFPVVNKSLCAICAGVGATPYFHRISARNCRASTVSGASITHFFLSSDNILPSFDHIQGKSGNIHDV